MSYLRDSIPYLRDAAGRIRTAANAATPGPWVADGGQEIHSATDYGPWVAETCQPGDASTTRANAAYIVTVHPGVGLALAALLDEIREGANLPVTNAAEALARAVLLGEATAQVTG